jgi:hypothetical protein
VPEDNLAEPQDQCPWHMKLTRGILLHSEMMKYFHFPARTSRSFYAYSCLLAVFLLWAPLGVSAWQSNQMACCEDGLCLVQNHAHGATGAQNRSADNGRDAMQCKHAQNQLMACKMACCPSEKQMTASPVIFVLSLKPSLSRPATSADSIKIASVAVPLSSQIPSLPPPR